MKDMIKRIREEREGFTLAELLIVVAIIAVLVAIAIPVFNAQLEKAREATDAANLRAAYAEIMADAVTEKTPTTKTVEQQQTKAGWEQGNGDFPSNFHVDQPNGTANNQWTLSYVSSGSGAPYVEAKIAAKA